jgi:hypothetical protein
VVRHGGGERDRPTAREDRHDHSKIREMRAAAVGIVQDIDVTLVHLLDGKGLDDRGHRRDQRTEVDGNGACLREGCTVEREEARRGVETFFHDWRAGAFQQRRLHLLSDLVEAVPDHLEGDWVEAVS